MNLKTKFLEVSAIFAKAEIDSPEAEAKLLLVHVCQIEYSQFFLHQLDELSDKQEKLCDDSVTERLTGRPIQYVIGNSEFYGIELEVGEGVLIPRPETEVLVNTILNRIKPLSGDILDLCTGSGAVAIALQAELKHDCKIVAVDLSSEALIYSQKNIEKYKSQFPKRPITLLHGDLFAPVTPQQFSIIVSNPPYVTEAEYAELALNVKEFEPKLALTAPDCGLEILKRIAAESPSYLTTDGVVMCEMGSWQGAEVKQAFLAFFNRVEIIKDYTGRDRFVLACGKIK